MISVPVAVTSGPCATPCGTARNNPHATALQAAIFIRRFMVSPLHGGFPSCAERHPHASPVSVCGPEAVLAVSLILELLREVFALSPSPAILVSAQGNPDFHPVPGACPPAPTLDMWHVSVYRTQGQVPPHQSVTRRTVPDLPLPVPDICRQQ